MNRWVKFLGLIIASGLLWTGCKKDTTEPDPNAGLTYIPPSTQVSTGNASDGLSYMLYGNYIGGGIEYNTFVQFFGADNANLLNRTGNNAIINTSFNAFDIDTVTVVGGIVCFGCHSSSIDGQFYMGLGNPFRDFTQDQSPLFAIANGMINNNFGANSPEAQAFSNLHRGGSATAPYIITPFVGVNPAFRLEEAAVANRDPASLEWLSSPGFSLGSNVYASDAPPLWNLKKKHALYYNGMGRGDFRNLLMQVTLVGIADSTEARRIHNNFDDVLAWLEQLQPPAYPNSIDQSLAAQGQVVFNNTCSRCHGTYDSTEYYPNYFVDADEVGTDPTYAEYFVGSNFADWFNSSWLSMNGAASLQPGRGYVAPPLDGVWATAPYLHNGSVPTLEDLLNSPQRPTYWRHATDFTGYDYTKVGWTYTTETGQTDERTYNTTLTGYGNGGHTYGDNLSSSEREAVIEYLKTL